MRFLFVSLVWLQGIHALPCKPSQETYGIVCVCTADYCDSIDPIGTLDPLQIVMYQSSLDGDRMKRSALAWSPNDNGGWQNVTLSPSVKLQTIKGFGNAFTDAAAINFYRMTPAVQEVLLEQYWGPSGTQYSIGRVPIGSSDFSTHVYSYDETVDDMQLADFSIQMDIPQKIPLISRARQTASESGRVVDLFASPWAPPPWMTEQNTTVHNPALKGGPTGPYAQAWALYFSKFLDEYAKHNLTFFAITAQNEPAGNTGAWQDLKFTAEQQRDFVKACLGPRLRADHPSVALMIMDDQRSHLPDWADVVMADPGAAQYVNGIGVHWYAAVEDSLPESFYFGKMAETHARHPGLFVLATEACEGYLPWSKGVRLGDWTRAETYAKDILGDLNAFAVGWTDWNAFLDPTGGPNWAGNVVDAPIILDVAGGAKFYKQPMYYALAHFAKFLPPGSVRIQVASSSPPATAPMEAVAFTTPQATTVVIVLNRDIAGHKYFIKVPGRGFINVDVPKHAFQTLVFKS